SRRSRVRGKKRRRSRSCEFQQSIICSCRRRPASSTSTGRSRTSGSARPSRRRSSRGCKKRSRRQPDNAARRKPRQGGRRGAWLLDLLGLPATASVGFVTGCHMANFTALAAARHELLRRAGWDVEANGLNGSPPLTVVVGDEVHVSVVGALRMLGIGSRQIV